MKTQPLGILLFPLKKSIKEAVLFDRKQGGRNGFKLKIHIENGVELKKSRTHHLTIEWQQWLEGTGGVMLPNIKMRGKTRSPWPEPNTLDVKLTLVQYNRSSTKQLIEICEGWRVKVGLSPIEGALQFVPSGSQIRSFLYSLIGQTFLFF